MGKAEGCYRETMGARNVKEFANIEDSRAGKPAPYVNLEHQSPA